MVSVKDEDVQDAPKDVSSKDNDDVSWDRLGIPNYGNHEKTGIRKETSADT